MKSFILALFLLNISLCKAQLKIKVYHEQVENGVNIYADNEEFCPLSVRVDFVVTNFDIQGGNNKVYVIEANKTKQLLTTLTVSKPGKSMQLGYKFLANYGDIYIDKYDIDYEYYLPYAKSKNFTIVQGYNGKFSHQNENSLDFNMPISTEITAIRDGIVTFKEDSNSKNCDKKECSRFNNLITIYHSDGTFASYVHIKKGGSAVKVGEKVSKGQMIAYSGDVGWTQGPHLHLIVYQQKLDKVISLPVKFKTGDKIEALIEGKDYLRLY